MSTKTYQSSQSKYPHRSKRTVQVTVMASKRPDQTPVTKKSSHKPGSAKKRVTSNLFGVLQQHQIAELRELFNLLDANNSGVIEREDLRTMLTTWNGSIPPEAILDELMAETRGLPLNFTLLLTMFAQELRSTDPPDVINNAFQCFDMAHDGTVDAEELRVWLTTKGDHRLTSEEVDEIFHRMPIENGRVKYAAFAELFHVC